MTCPACDSRVRALYEASREVTRALRSGSPSRLVTATQALDRVVNAFESVVLSCELDCVKPTPPTAA